MTQLQATQFGFFNPGRLSDKDIERTFIARKGLFEHLFKKIIDHKTNDIPQHLLIIGQRGMGKTSLLLRLAVELKKEPYNKSFIPLTFPEEQYNIDRLSKFWLNSLDSLADALDREQQTELVKKLDEDIASFSGESDGFALFEEWTKKVGRRAVLLVDNLNLIFDKISTDDQHKLRAILMQEGAPIVVGASSVSIDQTVDYGAPFYDAFQTTYLTKLDLQQSIELLKNLGQLTTGDHSLDSLFTKNQSRIAALHHLTGGTPRTLTMLFPLIRDGFNTEIQYDLEALLDVITPLYKARFEELSSQMQVVLDAIALHWDPIDLEELRNVTQLTSQQLSPQVKRLTDIGWIKKLKSNKSKGGVYEISERFFNVWYLMRRSSRRQIRELYCLTKFLEMFYGEDADMIAKARLNMEHESSTNNISWDLALAGATQNIKIKSQLEAKSYKALINLAKSDKEILNRFDIPVEHILTEAHNLAIMGDQLFEEEKWNESIKVALQILRLIPSAKEVLPRLAFAYSKNGEYENQIKTLQELISWEKSSTKDRADAYTDIGRSFELHLKDIHAARENYGRALEIDPNHIGALDNLIAITDPHDDPDFYESLVKKSLEIDPQNILPRLYLGVFRAENEQFSEAEELFLAAQEIDSKLNISYLMLSSLYTITNQLEKAEAILKNGLSAIPKDGEISLELAIIYESLSNIELAKFHFDTAIKSDFHSFNHNHVGNFYLDNTDEYSTAEALFLQSYSENNYNSLPIYNLLFLLRDKLNEKSKALTRLNDIPKDQRILDSHALNLALFEYYENNLGSAKKHILIALGEIKDNLPSQTQDDWWRTAATIVKLGHGEHLLSILQESGNHIVLRPYYEAIKAMLEKDPEAHFNQIAAELREPTRKILEFMQRYNAN